MYDAIVLAEVLHHLPITIKIKHIHIFLALEHDLTTDFDDFCA
jgi:hypothetical protein